VTLGVLTSVSVRIIVFWDVMLHSLVGRHQCFGGTYYFSLQGGRVNHVGKNGVDVGKRQPGLGL
jgi:hypothetical protein